MISTENKMSLRDKLLSREIRKQTSQPSSVQGVSPACCQIPAPMASPAIPALRSLQFLSQLQPLFFKICFFY